MPAPKKRAHPGNGEFLLTFCTGFPTICLEGFTYNITSVRLINTANHIKNLTITDIHPADTQLTIDVSEFETFQVYANRVDGPAVPRPLMS